MYHLFNNTLATGGAVTLADVPAATDQEFTARNGHYIFTEDWQVLAAAVTGATVTAVQSSIPHINMVNPHQIYPINPSVTIPTNVQVDDYRAYPFQLPRNEEIAWLLSDSASEQVNIFTFVGTPDWNTSIPRGAQRLTAIATASVVKVANTWSGLTPLVFTNQLRAGVYAVVGAYCVAAGSLAFRLVFDRRRMYMGHRTRPGDLCTQSYGLIPNSRGRNWMGEWGRFHTYVLPQVEVWANASATLTHTFYLDLIYMGEDMGLLAA